MRWKQWIDFLLPLAVSEGRVGMLQVRIPIEDDERMMEAREKDGMEEMIGRAYSRRRRGHLLSFLMETGCVCGRGGISQKES